MAIAHCSTKRAKSPHKETRNLARGIAMALLLALGLGALWTSSAQAAKIVDRVIGTTAAGTTGGLFNTPRGVAVNDATTDGNGTDGWFYVADGNNHRIQAFNAAGVFQWAIGRNVSASITTGDNIAAPGFAYEKCVTASDCQGGNTNTAIGGFIGTGAGMFEDPMGMAVNQATGDVYVRDRDNRRVQQFTADGDFIRMWGFDVIVATGPPPNSNGTAFEVCDVTNGNLASHCKIGTAGAGVGQFGTTGASMTGIAVQQSTGDVFVADPGATANRRVLKFEANGSAPAAIGSSAVFGSSQPLHVAVDSNVLYAGRTTTNELARYDLQGAGCDPVGVPCFLPPLAIQHNAMDLDLSSERLLIAENELGFGTLVSERANPATSATTADRHLVGAGFSHANGNGFALNSTSGDLVTTPSVVAGHFIAIADDDGAPAASADPLPPTDVGAATATLHGTITTSDSLATAYRIEYSRDGVNWVSAGGGQVAGPAGGVEVSASVSGLRPNTLYRTRLVTSRAFGNPELPSAELTFLTDSVPPAVSDVKAVSITDGSARLQARINPNSSQTGYRFEYGVGNFNSSVPVPDAIVGGGPDYVFVSQEIAGLSPGAQYQFRVVASSSAGVTATSPSVFTTGQAALVGDGRAYEMVSPPDKAGSAGVGLWGGGMVGAASDSGVAARRGDRFAAQGTVGSVLLDSPTAYASDWAFADRSAQGWTSHSPVSHAASNQQAYRFLMMADASDALNTVVWVSNGGLIRPFPELAAWPNLGAHLVSDWAGRWEMLLPTDFEQVQTELSIRMANSLASADGSTVLTAPNLGSSARAAVGGLEGPDDPSHPDWSDLQLGRAVYVDDLSAGLSDSFDGNGRYSNVGVCTGLPGAGRTELPAVTGGDLTGLECQAGIGGRERLISSRGAAVHPTETGEVGSVENAISRDGSRVFFLSPDPLATGVPAPSCSGAGAATLCPPQLYIRQRNSDGSESTRWVSRAAPGLFGTQDATLTGDVRFAGASADGDKVFFQTASPLTADDPNGACGAPCTTGTPSVQSWDLFMYDLPDGPDSDPATPDADPAGGTLTRISAGPSSSDCNVVSDVNHSSLRFVSDDGRRAYFTCAAPLSGAQPGPAGGVTSPTGATTTTDATNLYAYDAGSGGPATWSFVARLPKSVLPTHECATTGSQRRGALSVKFSNSTVGFLTGTHCVAGTADGTFVTFWTPAALTADDPDAASFDGYAFDLDAGELTRITAPQGGVGGSYLCNPDFSVTAGVAVQCHGDNGFGNSAQPDLGVVTEPTVPGARTAIFQTRSRLVAHDTDDAYDVYAWRNGALDLVSTGSSAGGGDIDGTGGAFYKGNDANGRNIYIATNDRLTWQDHDAVLDIYAARVGGGIPEPLAPSVCAVLASGCHSGSDAPAMVAAPDTGGAAGGRDAQSAPRVAVTIGALSRKARLRAARSGVLRLRVSAAGAERVRVVARSRLNGRRSSVVGVGRAKPGADGKASVRVALRRGARRRLAAGRPLRIALSVSAQGARSRSMTLTLRRSGR